MTTPITLARDATGHVRLSPEQAAAVARWLANQYEPGDDDIVPIIMAVENPSIALAYYTLRVAAERERLAGVVAAAVQQEVTRAEADAAYQPYRRDYPAVRDRHRAACAATEAAVRAAGLAGDT